MRRVAFLQTLRQTFVLFEAEVRYAALPVSRLLEKSAETLPFARPCLRRMREGVPFPEAWREAVETSALWAQEKALLVDFGEAFGQCDAEGALSLLRLYQKKTGDLLKKAEEEKERQMRLAPSLGAAAAALLLVFSL